MAVSDHRRLGFVRGGESECVSNDGFQLSSGSTLVMRPLFEVQLLCVEDTSYVSDQERPGACIQLEQAGLDQSKFLQLT